MNRRVAARYALALMDLGEEMKVLDKIADDLRDIALSMHASRELSTAMSSPVVSPDRKLRIMREIFGNRTTDITMKFIELLVRKGRPEYLLATAEEFLDMLDVKQNIVNAKISSASKLTQDEQTQLQSKLERMTGKRIRPEFLLDPELRGGFIARIGDELVDASLRHQLMLLKEEFKRGGSPILN